MKEKNPGCGFLPSQMLMDNIYSFSHFNTGNIFGKSFSHAWVLECVVGRVKGVMHTMFTLIMIYIEEYITFLFSHFLKIWYPLCKYLYFLLKSRVITSKAQLQNNWSDTYKSLPFVSKKEDERRHLMPSRVGTHIYLPPERSISPKRWRRERKAE